jgi:hypothetical protein
MSFRPTTRVLERPDQNGKATGQREGWNELDYRAHLEPEAIVASLRSMRTA